MDGARPGGDGALKPRASVVNVRAHARATSDGDGDGDPTQTEKQALKCRELPNKANNNYKNNNKCKFAALPRGNNKKSNPRRQHEG